MHKTILAIFTITCAVPSLAQSEEDPQQMIVPLVQAYGHACGKALYTVPHDGTNQIFDLVCSTNPNGSGAERAYVIDLSTGTIVITPK